MAGADQMVPEEHGATVAYPAQTSCPLAWVFVCLSRLWTFHICCFLLFVFPHNGLLPLNVHVYVQYPPWTSSQAFQEINLAMRTSRYNARFNHCFIDEDMLGTAKGLARRVHRKLMELRVMGRFLLRLKTLKRKTIIPVRSSIGKNRICEVNCGDVMWQS